MQASALPRAQNAPKMVQDSSAQFSVQTPVFAHAAHIHRSLTARGEQQLLGWLGRHAPAWLGSDALTLLGLLAQCAAGALFALARTHRPALVGVALAIALNWLGDSLDGTLARLRHQERPRYGFYVDHIVDVFGSVALMAGLACSGFLHPTVALAMLAVFLVLSAESFLATYTLGRFEMAHSLLGPTEIRLLLIAGVLWLLHSPWSTLLGHRFLLFDLGGVIATAGMVLMALATALRHTRQLYLAEPLPRRPAPER